MQNETGYFEANTCDLDEFKTLISQTLDPAMVPHADDVQKNIPIYDMVRLRPLLEDLETRKSIMAEWAHVMLKSAGAIVLRKAYDDTRVLDEATAIYEQIIADEKRSSGGGSDHFAAAGSNDRVWNALQKLCEANPEVFLRYFANTAIATNPG